MAEITTTTEASKGMSTSQSSPTGNGKKGFLSLPGEVRNKIYRLLFWHHDNILGEWHRDRQSLSDQLLRTCRQVHTEARSILYGENTFEISIFNGRDDPYDAFLFVPRCFKTISWPRSVGFVSPPLRSLVRRLQIHICHDIESETGHILGGLEWTVEFLRGCLASRPGGRYLDYLNLNVQLDWDVLSETTYGADGNRRQCARMIEEQIVTGFPKLAKKLEINIDGMPGSQEMERPWRNVMQCHGEDDKSPEEIEEREVEMTASESLKLSLLNRFDAIDAQFGSFDRLFHCRDKLLRAAEQGDEAKFDRRKDRLFRRVKDWYVGLELTKRRLEEDKLEFHSKRRKLNDS